MKRTLVALLFCPLVSVGRSSGNSALVPTSYREILAKAGFIGLRSDHSLTEVGEKNSYLLLALIGNARLEAKRITFRADRIVFIYYLKEADTGVTHPFEIYAEGNVVVGPGPEYGVTPKVFLTAGALYYDGRTLQGLAADVAVRARRNRESTGSDLPQSLALFAKELRFRAHVEKVKKKAKKARVVFHYFAGKDIVVTTCDLARPHWGLKCESLEAEEEKADETGKKDRQYTFRLGGTYLEVGGRRILPLPPAVASTRYFNGVPLKRVSYVNSRKFGYGFRSTWTLNRTPLLGSALKALKRKTGVPTEVDVQLDVFSKRGVGVGTEIEYGRKPSSWRGEAWRNMKGDLRFYWIHDQGEDRKEDELFPGHPPDEWRTKDRFRLRTFHRMTVPVLGSLDWEVSHWRDRNFYKEFFERELYRERNPGNPETYFQWRRPVGDDLLFSVLTRPRVNDFQDYVEYLPEGKVELFPKRLSDVAGPTVQAEARAGNLRFRPDDFNKDTKDSFRTGRYHAQGTAALPVGISRYIRFRPYYEAKGTIYERRWQIQGGADRLVQDAGVTASTHFWRNYRFDSSLLNTSVIRHVIVPRVSYYNAFYSNHDKSEFYQFDSIDALDRLEYLELALATYLLGRSKGVPKSARGAVRRLIELRARVRYYPEPTRDHMRGGPGGKPQRWSNVYLDCFADVFSPYVQVGVESEIDTSRGIGFAVLDPYITVGLPGRFRATMGELFIAKDGVAGIPKSNYLWANVYWQISPLYLVEAYYRYDFANNSVSEQYYGISRVFHCFTVETGVEIDEGEDELKWMIHAYPTGTKRVRW